MNTRFIKEAWQRKWVRVTAILVGILLLLFLFRFQIYGVAGRWLIDEDELEKAEVIFVLSGNAIDRGAEAAKLFEEGWAPQIICTGEEDAVPVNWPDEWLSTGEFTKQIIVSKGVPEGHIGLIPIGTSTWEEHEAILNYCKENDLKKVIVLSSRFHTQRISMVFEDPFEEAGIDLIIRGAVESQYEEAAWWEKEEGMIFVNNEYIKIIYYWWNY